jgi:hypothetical protein
MSTPKSRSLQGAARLSQLNEASAAPLGTATATGPNLAEALKAIPEDILNADLNWHAVALLAALPEPLGEVCLEICAALGCQPSHLVLGHLLKADQRSEVNAPLLLPEWTSTSEVVHVSGQGRCESCGRPMQRSRPGVRFCCNACGSGRYEENQLHSEGCEFYVKPMSVLAKTRFNPNIPPEDPALRKQWENVMYQRHLGEAQVAETAPPNSIAEPDGAPDPYAEWLGKPGS